MHLTLCGHGQANSDSFFVVGFLWRMLWDSYVSRVLYIVVSYFIAPPFFSSFNSFIFWGNFQFSFFFFYCLPENLFNINGVLTVLSGLQIACARVSVVYYTYPKYILGEERITTANNFVEKTLWFHYFRTMRKTIQDYLFTITGPIVRNNYFIFS